jgi:Mating-type protein MAT alpha 1 HMG-box
LPQKTKSGLIRSLWEQDHWKHFWAIAAKAYSELRDNHMGEITLESFLKNVTGFLGVIPAAQYLEAMGWILATDTEGQVHLTKSTSTAEGENVPLISNLSVRDVVNHCYQIGLLARPQRSARSNNNIATMTMSFAAAPKAASTGPTKMQSHTSDGQDARGREVGDVVSAHEINK